mmetsp:Transcript_31899/g.101748  ORF Transcript_31899/g.101748 Transcript_31899/m.101748 type:complete len:242 (+) Transcript_31899:863-1588(+)
MSPHVSPERLLALRSTQKDDPCEPCQGREEEEASEDCLQQRGLRRRVHSLLVIAADVKVHRLRPNPKGSHQLPHRLVVVRAHHAQRNVNDVPSLQLDAVPRQVDLRLRLEHAHVKEAVKHMSSDTTAHAGADDSDSLPLLPLDNEERVVQVSHESGGEPSGENKRLQRFHPLHSESHPPQGISVLRLRPLIVHPYSHHPQRNFDPERSEGRYDDIRHYHKTSIRKEPGAVGEELELVKVVD